MSVSTPNVHIAPPSERTSPRRSRLSPRDFSMAIALACIWIFFAIRKPAFLDARNLSMLMIDLSMTAILAMGMLLVILPGHIDLSAGSGAGMLGAIAATLIFQAQWPAPVAMACGFVVAIVLWTV